MGNRKRPKAPRPTTSVVVAYIHPGETSSFFTVSLGNLIRYHQVPGTPLLANVIQEWSSANVSGSRNNLTARFLDETDAEWLLWIDADMQFEHDAAERLIASADVEERPIVGGLCFGMSQGRLFPTIYQWVKAESGLTTCRVGDYPLDELVQCAATGAAFLLVHRRVLTAMRERAFSQAFPWFQETELGGQPVGEDLTFCIRAGLCDFPVFVDTAVKIGHHKSMVLDHDMFQAQKGG